MARPRQGSGDPVGARDQGPLLPPGTPRRLHQRRRLHRQAHDRHREAPVRDRRSEVEGHAAGGHVGGSLADRARVDLRPHRRHRQGGPRQRDQDPGPVQARRRPPPPAKGAKGRAGTFRAAVDTKTSPRDQVAAMDATKFFTRVASCFPAIRRPRTTRRCWTRSSSSASSRASPSRSVDPATAKSVEEGVKTAIDAVVHRLQGPERCGHPQRLAHRSRAGPLGHRVRTPRGGGVERHRPQRARGRDLHEHVPRRRPARSSTAASAMSCTSTRRWCPRPRASGR